MDCGRVTLLELVCIQMHCDRPIHLKKLDVNQRRYLAEALEKIPVEIPTTREWNNLLHYAVREKPKKTSAEARNTLLAALKDA